MTLIFHLLFSNLQYKFVNICKSYQMISFKLHSWAQANNLYELCKYLTINCKQITLGNKAMKTCLYIYVLVNYAFLYPIYNYVLDKKKYLLHFDLISCILCIHVIHEWLSWKKSSKLMILKAKNTCETNPYTNGECVGFKKR
jgi:hypothetical protein